MERCEAMCNPCHCILGALIKVQASHERDDEKYRSVASRVRATAPYQNQASYTIPSFEPLLAKRLTGMAEMVTYLPISSPFIRFAGRWVDEAFGVAAGYNFFVFEAALVPFEVTACNVVINFWSEAVPVGAIIAIVICSYASVL